MGGTLYVNTAGNAATFLQSYQWLLGDKRFPTNAMRVYEQQPSATKLCSPPSESYFYYLKALKVYEKLGQGSALTTQRWANPFWQIQTASNATQSGTGGINSYIYGFNRDINLLNSVGNSGTIITDTNTPTNPTRNRPTLAGPMFLMAGDFTRRTRKGTQGLNLDRLKQCQLMLNFNAAPSPLQLNIYIAYDNALVIKENCSVQVYH
jgi:hypothetical protein